MFLAFNKKSDKERTPDIERIKRFRWCSYVLNNYKNSEIFCWEKICKTPKGSQRRVFFWIEKEKYLVILGENRAQTSLELITAYYVTLSGTLRGIARDKKICTDPRK